MKKILPTVLVALIFIAGLFLFFYPTLSNLYNEHLNNSLIGEYEEEFSQIKPEQYKEAMEAAKAYNENRHNKKYLEERGLTYDNVLNLTGNGVMGYIEIPKISVSLVIYHSVDDELLQKGIGHVKESSLPIGGKSTHAVLAGHTGLPSAKLLTNIDHLNIGDNFYIHVLDEVLEYRIDNITVVEPHEVSKLNVESGKDYVTLVTCTPYGVNSHRLLVRGVRVDGNEVTGSSGLNVQNDILNIDIKIVLTFSLIGLFLIFVIVRKLIFKRKKKNFTKKCLEKQAFSEK